MSAAPTGCRQLFTGVDELNAIPLIFEGAREVKPLPSTIPALILEFRRACFCITSIPHAVQVEVCLVGVRRGWAIIFTIVHAVTICVLALARAAGGEEGQNLRGGEDAVEDFNLVQYPV